MKQTKSKPAFLSYDLALEAIREVRPALAQIARCDGDLARQLKRALMSVPLNLAEGRRRVGKDQLHHFRIASGSAAEALAALEVAEAFGYVAGDKLEVPMARLDRTIRVIYGLTRS